MLQFRDIVSPHRHEQQPSSSDYDVNSVTRPLSRMKNTTESYFNPLISYSTFHSYWRKPETVPWLKRLSAGLSPWRPGFAPESVHLGFVVDKVELAQVFLRVLRFSPVSIIPPLLHTHLSPPHEVCQSPDQAEYCHTLDPKLGAWPLTQHVTGTDDWRSTKRKPHLLRDQ
jgi:hypothetical protein